MRAIKTWQSAMRKHSKNTHVLLGFVAAIACVYVAGRLWATTHELHYLREEVKHAYGTRRSLSLPATPGGAHTGSTPTDELNGVLFYNARTYTTTPPPLEGPRLLDDPLPIQPAPVGTLLGQIDVVEHGQVRGWACVPGSASAEPLMVVVYVDGIEVGRTHASLPETHPPIRRLCQLDMVVSEGGTSPGVVFRLNLPPLVQGVHTLQAYVVHPRGDQKQELNQSPLQFAEIAHELSLANKIKRKDEIIQTRNIQIATLWQELHEQQPWRNALEKASRITFDGADDVNATTRKLAFIAINTGIGSRRRRDVLRKTWVPQGALLTELEQDKGIVVRFVVGYSEQANDAEDAALQEEMATYKDILRIDMVDSYDQLALKTLRIFTEAPKKVDAQFYFKVDDDVAMNVEALYTYLLQRKNKPNLYMGCMKSGPVLTDKSSKWYEPESWRFGDAMSTDGKANYMRHASGQIYGVSRQVARYISQNAAILHRYANEDTTFGSWLLGLDVEYVPEGRFCCQSQHQCGEQTNDSNTCIGYVESACAGICNVEERMEHIYFSCMHDPLHRKAQQATQR